MLTTFPEIIFLPSSSSPAADRHVGPHFTTESLDTAEHLDIPLVPKHRDGKRSTGLAIQRQGGGSSVLRDGVLASGVTMNLRVPVDPSTVDFASVSFHVTVFDTTLLVLVTVSSCSSIQCFFLPLYASAPPSESPRDATQHKPRKPTE